jgi:hypothetical protein
MEDSTYLTGELRAWSSYEAPQVSVHLSTQDAGELRPREGQRLKVAAGQYRLIVGRQERLIDISIVHWDDEGFVNTAKFTVVA